jgi:hypothetical protein
LVGVVAVAAAFYGVTRYISIEVEEDEEEEKDNKQRSSRPGNQIGNEDGGEEADEGDVEEEDEEEDDDYDDALIFLPTGFSRPKPKTFYRGSDPEWQEYRKVATDRPRVEKIRSTHAMRSGLCQSLTATDELSALIRSIAKKNPGYAARLGTIDASKGKAWIEVKFPDGPPIEYERPGIELTEDLEWRKATRPVEELHHQRLAKLLYPSAVSTAIYQDTKRKAAVSWRSFQSYLGWEVKAEPTTVKQVIQKVLADPAAPSPPGTSAAPAASDSTASAAPDNKQPAETDSPLAKDVGFALPDPKKLTLDLTQFRQDFRKAVKPYAMQPPRGTFVVMGLIEVYGDRARMTLNVSAAYDPKQGRYVSLQAAVWNLVDHRQRPRGGP